MPTRILDGFPPARRAGITVTIALSAIVVFLNATAAHAAEPAELFRQAASGSTLTVDHSAWDRLLKAYVKTSPDGVNRVDYATFEANGHKDLKNYIRSIEETYPTTLDRAEQLALLANLYNAKTIDIVLDHYPVASIKDISLGGSLLASFTGGPWKAKVLRLEGVELSLDDIEHGILRPIFKDPRVHYAVNCASIGCPNLQPEAFTGAKINTQLDAAARAYINHPRGVAVAEAKLVASSIYSWFKDDFGGSDEGVVRHLQAYAAPPLAGQLKSVRTISDHQYDWRLNDSIR